MAMVCPKCGSEKHAVYNSRPCADGIRRRRKCEKCGECFTTFECSGDLMTRLKERACAMGMDTAKKTAVDAVIGEMRKILMEKMSV